MAIKKFALGLVCLISGTTAAQCSDANAPFPPARDSVTARTTTPTPMNQANHSDSPAFASLPLTNSTPGFRPPLEGTSLDPAESTSAPPADTFAINIAGDEVDGAAHQLVTPRSSSTRQSTAQANLTSLRNDEVKKWGHLLMSAQFWWYRAGNASECLSQICQVFTPILAGCAGVINDKNIALAAMVMGSCGVGLGRFSTHAYKESIERGKAANLFLEGEGVPRIVVLAGEIQA